jgi:hypothetical protein
MDTMAELVELVGIMGWRREQGKDHREGRARGCSWATHLIL